MNENLMITDSSSLDKEFVLATENFRSFLDGLKKELTSFDAEKHPQVESERFLVAKKKELFPRAVAHFGLIWKIVQPLDKETYQQYRLFYQQKLLPYLGEPEVNRHIYRKPLGYAGDFITMNYIYDGYDKFVGENSFEKLINNLTCSIPVSLSNIERKSFLKTALLEMIAERKGKAKITGIASGSAREVLELIREGKVPVTTEISLLDFELQALNYVQTDLDKIPQSALPPIKLIRENVVNLIRKPAVREKISGRDLIYAFGIYDYLGEVIARKLTAALFSCLQPGGKLIICNASVDKTDFRAYFEFLGEWEMIYRRKEEMLGWVEPLKPREVIFRDLPNEAYLYLIVKK
jgi:hypothetical protein